MHRVARRDLEALVFVAITCAPPAIQRALKSKLLEERDKARAALTRSICDKIDNGSYMVIVADKVGLAPHVRLGTWGVDEPVPAKLAVPEAVTK
jgi:hypothetical protein